MTIWPASVAVMVEFCPEASSASANSVLARGDAERGRQQAVGVLDLGHLGLAGGVEGGRGQDQDRGIDEEREAQRHGAVDGGEPERLALGPRASAPRPRVCTIEECR